MNYTSFYAQGALVFAVVCLPVIGLVRWRHRLGPLNAASWLVAYGALDVVIEHAGFTFSYTVGGPWHAEGIYEVAPHARVHSFMAGVYAVLGMALLVVIARTMLRQRSRLAWWTLLMVLVVGGSLELITDGPTGVLFRHGFPPPPSANCSMPANCSIPVGTSLFAYLLAWAAALAISWRPIFASPGSLAAAPMPPVDQPSPQ
jgi:hypothetical protein